MFLRMGMAIGLLAGAAIASAQPERRVFEDQGGLLGGDVDERGALRIQLWEPHIRYVILPETEEKVEALGRLLRRANESRRVIAVQYAAAAGRPNREAGTIDYPVCAIRFDELEFVPSAPCDDTAAPPASPDAALAFARALSSAGDLRQAVERLRPLAFEDATAQTLLLRVRANALAALAGEETSHGPAADAAFAEALADNRALAELEPDFADHRLAMAAILVDLGGYDEAKAMLDVVLERWPDEDYRVFVRYGALRRTQGDYQGALDALDRLVARSGPQEGMRYHYHRGWTLSLLGRHAEAEAEYTKGFGTQPDYASAFVRRGCARASLGRLQEALSDFDEGKRLLSALRGGGTGGVQPDLRALEADRARVAAAEAAGGGPVPGTCSSEIWKSFEKPRKRSPLLPGA